MQGSRRVVGEVCTTSGPLLILLESFSDSKSHSVTESTLHGVWGVLVSTCV